jgi:hypothetical protein
MQYIKNNTLTVEQFLEKLKTQTCFSLKQTPSDSELFISFPMPFRWGDGSESIDSLTLSFNPMTHNINKITIIGSNLVQIIGYAYLNKCYLWFTIKDMHQFDFKQIEDTPGVLIFNV